MKYVALAAFLALSPSAFAYDAPANTGPTVLPAPGAQPAQHAMPSQPADRRTGNANRCGGEAARARWSANGAPNGYSCYENPNGS